MTAKQIEEMMKKELDKMQERGLSFDARQAQLAGMTKAFRFAKVITDKELNQIFDLLLDYV